MTYDGYIRVSRAGERAGGSFISPDVQRDTIMRLAGIHQVEVGEIVEDPNVAGSTPIENRAL